MWMGEAVSVFFWTFGLLMFGIVGIGIIIGGFWLWGMIFETQRDWKFYHVLASMVGIVLYLAVISAFIAVFINGGDYLWGPGSPEETQQHCGEGTKFDTFIDDHGNTKWECRVE